MSSYRLICHTFQLFHAQAVSFNYSSECQHVFLVQVRKFWTEVEAEVKLRPEVSWPVCLGVRLPFGTYNYIFLFRLTSVGFLMLSTLSDERMGL
jgi:hypothetical protein